MLENMEFSLILSLKEMTRRRVTASLWNRSDIVALISTCKFHPYLYSDKFRKGNILYDQMMGKVERLLLPAALEDSFKETMHSIGFEILKFNSYQEKYIDENNHFFDHEIKIYWTNLGTIDKVRTAMSFVKENVIDLTLRYKIACIYCLENDVPILWEMMSEDERNISFKADSLPFYRTLIYFWESKMKKEVFHYHALCGMNANVFVDVLEYSACNGNMAATRYFFQKLTDEERKEGALKITKRILNRTKFSKEYLFEVLLFLLLQMNEKDRLSVFQISSYNLLCCFLEWPLQPFFNSLARLTWSYLDPSEFHDLLQHINVRNLEQKGCGYDYRSLFSGLWSDSPLHFKKYIILEKPWEHLLYQLYEIGDIGSANLMLQMVTPEQVERFITVNCGSSLISSLSQAKKFDCLVACLEACVRSEKVGEKLKENFEMFLAETSHEKIGQAGEKSYEQFFTLLNARISALAAKDKIKEETIVMPKKKKKKTLLGKHLL